MKGESVIIAEGNWVPKSENESVLKPIYRILENLSLLSILQGLNIVAPLITYPIAVRAVGISLYGTYVYALGISAILAIVFDLGITAFGSREVARTFTSGDMDLARSTVASLVKVRMASAVIGFVVCALWLHWSKFDFHLVAVLAFSTAGLQNAFLSNWYFQGRQTLRQITLVTVVSRLLSVLAVVFFIRTKAHFDLLVLFMTIPPFLFALVPFFMMVKECSLNMRSVMAEPVLEILRTCIPFSVSGISAIVKDRIGVVLVATTLRAQDAAVLDLASKVVELVAGVFYNLTRALYPHFAARPDAALFKKFFYGTLLVAVGIAGVLSLGKPFIVRMLTGDPSVIAQCPLGILCWVLPFLAGSSLLGHIVLLCNRQDRHFMGNLVLSAAFYLALLLCLYLAEWRSVVVVSLSYVAAIAFEFSHRVYLVNKLNLKAWIR